MWLSRKLSTLLNQKSSLHSTHHLLNSFHKKKEHHISFVLAVTSGVQSTGKSTFINSLGLQEVDRLRKLYRLRNNEQFIIQILEYNGIPPSMETFDGALICYDITNRDSMDNLPDMINTFLSHHVPCLLIGLKSDLTVLRTVDPHLDTFINSSIPTEKYYF
ncbi:uncharacterized protein EV154DRAFT_230240 [Mucor mucedo]|uniref:uncharacterized protein n=1 Tax=Mucor mucedo TaxID=29922 RepID=UPI0022205DB1|nr:uncharacterized protein EV154DRAFT_230240 [Mucor mucedo]KAI7891124.1 hypothetical protein EV154DRAFT_230240 [Mucor mucedo]